MNTNTTNNTTRPYTAPASSSSKLPIENTKNTRSRRTRRTGVILTSKSIPISTSTCRSNGCKNKVTKGNTCDDCGEMLFDD